MAFDLVSIGRISVDIYPEQIGVDIEDVTSFGKFVGGSATNVAIAAARHGRSAALITKTGADPFGNYLRRELQRSFGVDTRFIGTDPRLLTPVAFCAIKPPDDFPLYFYRTPTAPDLQITAVDVTAPGYAEAIKDARVFWATATGLCAEPSRSAHQIAWRLRSSASISGGCPPPSYTVLDLDYRPSFWSNPDDASEAVRAALPWVDVAVGNLRECEVAVGPGTAAEMARRLLDAGPTLAVVKMGSHGVLAATRSHSVTCEPLDVEVVNGLGAGDAFGGALVHGLLSAWPLEHVASFANAAGAYVAGQVACSSAMPTTEQVVALLRAHGRPIPPGTEPAPSPAPRSEP